MAVGGCVMDIVIARPFDRQVERRIDELTLELRAAIGDLRRRTLQVVDEKNAHAEGESIANGAITLFGIRSSTPEGLAI